MLKSKFFVLLLLLILSVSSDNYIGSFGTRRDNDDHFSPRVIVPTEKISLEGDVVSYAVNQSSIRIGNGIVDNGWKNVPQNKIDEYSDPIKGDGWIKSIHDDFYIYVLIAHPIDALWVAVELNATDVPETSMGLHHDGWVFGIGDKAPTGQLNVITWDGDVHFNSNTVHPTKDQRNDLSYEYIYDNDTNTKYIEFRRPLNTNDEEGFDYVLNIGASFQVKFASGLSPATHKQGGTTHLFTVSTDTFQDNQTTTNQTVTTGLTPADIKANNEYLLLSLTTLEMFVNFIVLILIVLFHKKE